MGFLHVVRRTFHGDHNWGELYIKTTDGKWEWLSYTYELPWKGDDEGKSVNDVSRIKIGIYALVVRTDGTERKLGGKGWRLELQGTGHRNNIQIHRAATSLRIKGCILPVHFNTLQGDSVRKGDIRIRSMSENIMDKIKSRLEALNGTGNNKGNPTVNIAAKMPAQLLTNRSHAYV